MTFQTNDDLENILKSLEGNREIFERYKDYKKPDEVLQTNYFTDQGPVEVSGNAQKINDHTLAADLLLAQLAAQNGLDEENWEDYMSTYFDPLEDKLKEAVYKEALKYVNPQNLQDDDYAKLTITEQNIEKTLVKESLEEEDLAKSLLYFQDEVKSSEIGPVILRALQDYQQNPNSVKALLAMKLRVIEAQKEKLEKEDSYGKITAYEGDSFRDYTRAGIVKAAA